MGNYTFDLDILESTNYKNLLNLYKEKYGDSPTKVTLTTSVIKDERKDETIFYTLTVQKIDIIG